MPGGVLEDAGVLEIGDAIVPVVAGAAARVGTGNESRIAPELHRRLKDERAILVLVRRRLTLVHEKHCDRARAGGQSDRVTGGVAHARIKTESARAGNIHSARSPAGRGNRDGHGLLLRLRVQS